MEPLKIMTPEGEIEDERFERKWRVRMSHPETMAYLTVTVLARSLPEARVKAEKDGWRAYEFHDLLGAD
jgi:hypothetical protein